MAVNLLDRLRTALRETTPPGRIIIDISQAEASPVFIVECDRGFRASISHDDVAQNADTAADAYWRMEELAQGERDEKGLLTPPAEHYDPGYLMDSAQHGALPAGSVVEMPEGCYARLWEEMKVMNRVAGDIAKTIPCPPASIELEVPGGRVAVRPLGPPEVIPQRPEDEEKAREAQKILHYLLATGPAEPTCSCENFSLGHAPGCAWKAWKDAQA